MLLKKLLKGHFRVTGITMSDIHTDNPKHPLNNMCEIEFHRTGRWSIFGWREHRNNSYFRKNVGRYTKVFRKNSGHIYFDVYRAGKWFVQYHTKGVSEIFMEKILGNILWIWWVYIIVVAWLNR